MTRLLNYIQLALLVSVVTLIVRIWPLTMQANSGQAPTATSMNGLGSVQLSNDTEAVFIDIEKILSDETKWPQSREEIEKLQERLKGGINNLSPAVQEQMLPRLVPRRWEIQALWLLAAENQPTDSDISAMRALADEINLLRTNPPSDVGEVLLQKLIKQEQVVRERVAKLELSVAIIHGKAALDAKDLNGIDLAIRELAGFDDDECKKLTYQLGLRREIAAATSDFNQLERLGAPDIKDYGLAKLNQSLIELRLRVALNAKTYSVPEKSSEQVSALERRVSDLIDRGRKSRRAEVQKRNREYQTWALTQLKSVPSFDALRDVEFAKIPSAVGRNNPLSRAYKDAEERAMNVLDRIMINRIAPIDQALLDEAVATWYRKVFQDRFDKLSDGHRLNVVTAFASTEKRTADQ